MKLSARTILLRTVQLVIAHPRPGALWFIGLTGPWIAIDVYGNGDFRFGSLLGLLAVFAQFMVTSALLRDLGLHRAWGRPGRAASFVGLGIVTTLAIGVGLLLGIVPGLFLYARWVLTSPLVIGDGMRMGEAMAASWQRTAGASLAIMTALILVFLPEVASFVLMLSVYPEWGPVPVWAAIAANGMISLSLILGWYLAVAVHVMIAEVGDDERVSHA